MRIVLAAILTLLARPAEACSPPYNVPHELDAAEQAVDTSAPSAIGGLAVDVQRGAGPRSDGCFGGSQMTTSCDDTGFVTLTFAPATDDRTPADRMGYEVLVTSGDAPFALEGAVRSDGRIVFVWSDGATDDQEALDFTLAVTPIDLAGNRGPTSEARVTDAGGFVRGIGGGGEGVALYALIEWLRRARRLSIQPA
jgi:hypothetical protein